MRGEKSYTQKVDIYSTGVVLFEVFYRPLPLGMERLNTLSALRRPLPLIPQEFGQELSVANKQKVFFTPTPSSVLLRTQLGGKRRGGGGAYRTGLKAGGRCTPEGHTLSTIRP